MTIMENQFSDLKISPVRISIFCLSLLLVAIHVYGINIVSKTSPFNIDYSAEGNGLYVVFRLVTAFLLMVSCTTIGYFLFSISPFRKIGFGAFDLILVSFVVAVTLFRFSSIILINFPIYFAYSLYLALLFVSTFSLLIQFESRLFKFRESIAFYKNGLLTFAFFLVLALAVSRIWFLSLDGDYITHYGQYIIQVIENQSIAPNDVWYHFFYSKGNMLEAIAVAALDHAAKLDISLIFIFVALCAYYRMIRNMGLDSKIALFTILALPNYLVTVDIGFFSKNHAIISAFILLQCYFIQKIVNIEDKSKIRFLYFIIACIIFNIIIISPPALPFFFISFFTIFLMSKSALRGYHLKVGIFHAAFYFSLIFVNFAINYLVTGLYEINPASVFFEKMNFEIFAKKYSPYLITYLEIGSGTEFGKFKFDTSMLFQRVVQGLHLDLFQKNFGYWLATIFGACGVIIFLREHKTNSLILIAPLLGGVLAMILVSQPVSVYRATSFAGIFMALFFVIGTFSILNGIDKKKNKRAILSVCFIALLMSTAFKAQQARDVLLVGKYAASRVDADTYYTRVSRERQFITGHSRIAVELRKQYGEKIGITTVSLVSNRLGRAYLMGTGLKSEVSYAFGKDWANISNAEPDKAYEAFRRHSDVLLLDLESIGISTIAHASFLQPNTMGKYFNIGMRDGNWIALVPKEVPFDGRPPTSAERRKWKSAQQFHQFRGLAFAMKEIYTLNGGDVSERPRMPDNFVRPQGWQ